MIETEVLPIMGPPWMPPLTHPLTPGPVRAPLAPVPHPIPLTAREHEVLQFVFHGFRRKQIGDALNISAKTADTHLSNILRKFRQMERDGCFRELDIAPHGKCAAPQRMLYQALALGYVLPPKRIRP